MSQYKALAQVPSHINTHLTNVIDENVQSSSKFVHNSVVVGTCYVHHIKQGGWRDIRKADNKGLLNYE